MSSITDIRLAPEGEKKISWVARNMPLCSAITTLPTGFARHPPSQGRVDLYRTVRMDTRKTRQRLPPSDEGGVTAR